MPRGVKRSEIEIIQAEILAAEKKREKNLQEAAAAKKSISKLQDKIEQQYAREIAKACRTSGIPLEEVLGWVKNRQSEIVHENGAVPLVRAKKPKAPTEKKKNKPGPRPKSPRKAPTERKKTVKKDAPVAEPEVATDPAETKE